MTTFGVLTALQALAAVLAASVARGRREYRPVAVFLIAMVTANAALWTLRATGVVPVEPPAAPLVGAAFAGAHVGAAIWLSWPAGVAALACAVFLGRKPWWIAAVYGALIGSLAIAYPEVRCDRRVYLAVELCALAASVGFAARWSWRGEAPRAAHTVTLVILAVELATLVGPYLGDPFRTWERAQAIYAALYGTLIVVQGGLLWGMSGISRSG